METDEREARERELRAGGSFLSTHWRKTKRFIGGKTKKKKSVKLTEERGFKEHDFCNRYQASIHKGLPFCCPLPPRGAFEDSEPHNQIKTPLKRAAPSLVTQGTPSG